MTMYPALFAALATLFVFAGTAIVVAFAYFCVYVQNVYGFVPALLLFVGVLGSLMFSIFYWQARGFR